MLIVSFPSAAHFAVPFANALEDCEILEVDGRGYTKRQLFHKITEKIQNHDFLWFEWGNETTAKALSYRRYRIPTIVRVHDFEIRTGEVKKICWDRVDAVWLVNEQARQDFFTIVPPKGLHSFVIPNGVETEIWPIISSGYKHLGMVSEDLKVRKGYTRALKFFATLPADWQLTIRSSAQPLAEKQRLEYLARDFGIEERLTFEVRGWRPSEILAKEDLIEFWRDKSHVLSTSNREAFQYSVAEAMLCGVAPALLRWDWGRPEQFYQHIFDSFESLRNWVLTTEPGPCWRSEVEKFDAKVLAVEVRARLVEVRKRKLQEKRRFSARWWR